MKVCAINEENMDEFVTILGQDMAADLERVFFRGLGVKNEDDKAVGALVYELIGSESDQGTKSFIRLLNSDSSEAFGLMEKAYSRAEFYDDKIAQSFYEVSDEKSAGEYKSVGFSMETRESDQLRITLGDLAGTEFAKKRKVPDHIRYLDELSFMEYRSAVKDFLAKGHKGMVEDLAYLPSSWFDRDISVCSTADDRVDGMFLVRTTPSGVLIPMLYYAYGPYYAKNLFYMLFKSIEKAMDKYPAETQIVISRINKASWDVMSKIMPTARGDKVFCGVRQEP